MNPHVLNTVNYIVYFVLKRSNSLLILLIAPALTTALYLTLVLRFLLPLPVSSPNLRGSVELGGATSGFASGLSECLGRGRLGVLIGRLASCGGDDGRVCAGARCSLLFMNQAFLVRDLEQVDCALYG